MHARQIRPEEVKRTEELFSISFDSPYESDTPAAQLYERYVSAPQNREQEHPLERFAAFADDDTTMMSSFIMQPFCVRFDGHDEPMYSIGGVATLPQYRRMGGIRACFEQALPYLYQKDVVFSYLYPFSTAYYRKFGYELCSKKQVFRVALAHIPAYTPTGSCYLLDASTAAPALADIPAIYRAWQKSYNMMVQDVPYDFDFIRNANPYKDQVFTYVYRAADDRPLAYMTFRSYSTPTDRWLECSRFFYLNEEGLQGLLTLAKGFASDYCALTFSLPEGIALEPLLPEWSFGAVTCQMVCNGMVRVIHVRKALQDAAYLGSGTFSVRIADSFIEENNHTFHITFADGRCRKITVDDADADVELSISSFSALLVGGYDSSIAMQFPNVKIHRNAEAFSRVFYRKPVYITTGF